MFQIASFQASSDHRRILVGIAGALLLVAAAASAQRIQVSPVAEAGGIYWQSNGDYESFTLKVTGPDGLAFERVFAAGETPALGLDDGWGNRLPDGLYGYDLIASPRLSAEQRRLMHDARAAGDPSQMAEVEARLPKGGRTSGSFRIEGGAILTPDTREPRQAARPASSGAGGPVGVADPAVVGVSDAATVLTGADGVIRNSLCVGFDCPNSPSFSDTTILMMENNTRIKFDDTSNTASFPSNDWEIEANSSLNGGASYLGINDCGSSAQGGCATDLVFAVEAGARASALFVESDGDVGLGTSNPVLDLHIVTGNTPSIRLEQDTSGGFGAQTWDIAGNETNFFIRDATGGSALPLRIQPGAPSNSVFIKTGGNVGIGTSSPDAKLDIESTVPVLRYTMTTAGKTWDFGDAGNGTLKVSEINSGVTDFRFTDEGMFRMTERASPPTTSVGRGGLYTDSTGAGALCWHDGATWIVVAGAGSCN